MSATGFRALWRAKMNMPFFGRAERAQSHVDAEAGVGQPVAPTIAPAAPPTDATAGILARRDSVRAELERFAKIDNARTGAESALAEVAEAAAKIDEAEAESYRLWAMDPDMPRPTPLYTEREALAKRRTLAEADVAAARNGAAAVESRRLALGRELAHIADELFAARVAKSASAAYEAHKTAVELADEFTAAVMRLDGIRDALFAARAEATNAQNAARIKATTDAIDALELAQRPDLIGDPMARARIAAEAKARLDAA